MIFVLKMKKSLKYIISFLPLVISTVIVILVLVAVMTIFIVLYGETGTIISIVLAVVIGGIWIGLLFWVFFGKTGKAKRLRLHNHDN